jgi:hypothetical protein
MPAPLLTKVAVLVDIAAYMRAWFIDAPTLSARLTPRLVPRVITWNRQQGAKGQGGKGDSKQGPHRA